MKRIILILSAIVCFTAHSMEQKSSYIKSVEQRNSFLNSFQQKAPLYVAAPRYMEDARIIKERIKAITTAENYLSNTATLQPNKNKPTLSSLPEYHHEFTYHDQQTSEQMPSFVSLNINVNNSRPSVPRELPSVTTYEQIREKEYFLDKNCLIPFFKPDMEKDIVLNSIKDSYQKGNIDGLYHYLQSELSKLDNASIADITLDRQNLYKTSRRLSFILKHIENPIFQNLLAIYSAKNLDDAQYAYSQLQYETSNTDQISVTDKQPILLDSSKKSFFMRTGKQLLEQREDYRQATVSRTRMRSPLNIDTVIETQQQTKPISQTAHQKEKKISYNIDDVIEQQQKTTIEKQKVHTPVRSPYDITTIIEQNNEAIASHKKETIEQKLHELHTVLMQDQEIYDQATLEFLEHMHQCGLIKIQNVNKQHEILQTALTSFIYNMIPDNPRTHPKEFMLNATKHALWAGFHLATGGEFIAAERVMALSLQINNMFKQDYSTMTDKEFAEHLGIASAEMVKTCIANKVAKTVAPKLTKYFNVKSSKEVGDLSKQLKKDSESLQSNQQNLSGPEVVTADGNKFKVSTKEIEEELVHLQENASGQKNALKNAAQEISKDIKAENINKTVDDLIKSAMFRETKRFAKFFEKPGGYQQALKDFELLAGFDVRDIPKGKLGKLADGRMINVRWDSSADLPTLEIFDPIKNKSIKIRYIGS